MVVSRRSGWCRPSRSIRVILKRTYPLLWCLLVAVGARCRAPESAIAIWTFSDSPIGAASVPEFSDEPTSVLGTNRVELAGAINETLSFRFAVRPGTCPIAKPDLRVAELTSFSSRIDPSVVQLYRVHSIKLGRRPGWHVRSVPPDQRDTRPLDVLVPIRAPRGGLPGTLRPGRVYRFWADLTIPKGTFEGVYSTEIELLSDGKSVGSVVVQLEVWPFILPDEAGVTVLASVDHRRLFRHHVQYRAEPYAPHIDDWRHDPLRDRLDGLLMSTLRELYRHRLTFVLPSFSPIVKIDAHGDLLVDWEQYDAVVGPCMSGEAFFNLVPLAHLPLPFEAILTAAGGDSGFQSSRYGNLLRQYMVACARHFEENGWLDRCYANASETGVEPGSESAAVTRRFFDTARRADPRIPVLSRMFPQDLQPYGWRGYPYEDFAESVDIWMPPAQFFDIEEMKAQREAGRRTWMAVDRPPFSGSTSIHADTASVRVLPWQALQLGVEVLDIGCVNAWPDADTYPTPEDCVAADPDVLLYPGGPFGLSEPVASVRLKHLRRGLQDAAYLRLLEDHGLGHVGVTLRQSLAPYAGSSAYRTHFADGRRNGWPDKPRLFEAARHIMAEQFASAIEPSPSEDRADRFTRGLEWRRFMEDARRVDISVDGARVRFLGTREAPAAEIECALTITNRTRIPVDGTVRFAELPPEWSTDDAPRAVLTVPPGGTRFVTVTARGSVLPMRPEGYFPLPLEFTTTEGTTYDVEARVSCVAALPLAGTLTIDGDLSDWPVGTTNVASDFSLIAETSPGTSDTQRRSPRRATIALVMRDRDSLYVAVNCETDKWSDEPDSRRKGIRYEDMIPMDEELIEILIDPLNVGTRSPTDLYHIVIKQSGMHLAEKGVGFDPPVGRREPWPVDMELGTHVVPGRWTTEIRIPLAAFNAPTAEHVTWGFNITRMDNEAQEFSTWSGAVGNAYDPLSLGNLHVP